ncbi:Calcineurin-like phosphoesterase [Actinomadura rubteroloni]|uniref:Calcineurin-like phosphoesterase n=1 Tax=Actinomadura rubteroloni TaxID=1926885 RepID=A0A2P4UAY9_9ACTN|nr:metallophosphoesterase [Actinomadura rubteroloni]POM22204.1 Calcineurin-like phosphoesterase [Actinomadura rubteroloni]
MTSPSRRDGALLAISDVHTAFEENRAVVDGIRPGSPDDWLIVAGDIAERAADVEATLALLADRFARVVWTPGNHELWTTPGDPCDLRGEARYRHLVQVCRRLGVSTPEDPYPVWTGPGGPVTVAPLFVLYDYTFRRDGITSKEAALERAQESGVVCTDEVYLHPEPFASADDWCRDRLARTEAMLDACDPALPTVLVNHFPLVRDPTRILRYPDFALWCGTEHTADWHVRYRASAVVYGHLHIPRTTWHDGVRFEEVSLGYPREWRSRPAGPARPRQILPVPEQTS